MPGSLRGCGFFGQTIGAHRMSGLRFGIVGGGMLGMTLALRLSQAGHDVEILEAADHVGGLAAPWQLGDIVWDRHYHVTLASDLALRALLKELDLEQDIRWSTTRTGFYVRGELYSLSDTLEFLRFPPLTLLQKARLATTIVYASRITDWRPLERITALDWLTRISGRATVDAIWYPLLRAKLGTNAERASAAFIWAVIARMYAARRSGMKREQFGYVDGGYARVLKRFEEFIQARGIEIATACRAQRVESDETGVVVLDQNGASRHFDRVVVTVAAPLAARICPQLTLKECALLRGVQYQGIICASLLTEKPISAFYVTNITDRWVPFTGVIEMTCVVDRKVFGGKSLIYLPKYVPAEDPAFDISDDQLEEDFLQALERMHPTFSRRSVCAFRVSRVRYVLPITTLNYSDSLPPIRTTIPDLYLVNSAHIVNGTLNVNETVQLANRTAELLISDASSVCAKVAHEGRAIA
jgi:protoporphyrinogen oxidase